MPPALNLATASTAAILAEYNTLARSRGLEQVEKWHGTHVDLVTNLALLRAGRVVPHRIVPTDETGIPEPVAQAIRKPHTPVRNAVLRVLAIVDHYEHRETGKTISKRRVKKFNRAALVSVGLPYAEVLRRVRRRVPYSMITRAELRWYATMVRTRAKGFEHGRLPQKRPHGMKGVKIAKRGVQ